MARQTGDSQEKTQKLVNSVISVMGEMFEEGDSVAIANFGSFETKKRLERIIVNPSTAQRMLVPPKVVLSFKPSAQVKDSLKKGGQE